jgi:hypothetical protein
MANVRFMRSLRYQRRLKQAVYTVFTLLCSRSVTVGCKHRVYGLDSHSSGSYRYTEVRLSTSRICCLDRADLQPGVAVTELRDFM